jgi:hypothetical protein
MIVIALMSIPMLAGCNGGTSKPANVTFSQLVDKSASFHNRSVTVDGYYFSGFEISSLSSALVPSSFNPSNVTPVQPLIWITGDLGQDVYPNLKQQSDTPSGYAEKFGHVRITGIFQTGKFGHMDAYNFLITVTEAAIIP